MWEQDWARLGIAPTTELGAIKKAYALKLKVTRPDDDAGAYQALRAAYERVQHWARDEAEAAPQPVVSPAAEAQREVDVRASPAEPAAQPEDDVDPADLARQADAIWRRDGGAALAAQWPGLERQIAALPLHRTAPCSRAFAEWVLHTPALPDEFLKRLNELFGWQDDYRAEYILGSELAYALDVMLDERLPRAIKNAELLARAAPLTQLHALNTSAGERWKAWLLSAASGAALAGLKDSLGTALLTRLGLTHKDQKALDLLFTLGMLLRWLLALAGMALVVAIAGYHLPVVIGIPVVVCLVAVVWRRVAWLAGVVLHWDLSMLGQSTPELLEWRSDPKRRWWGLGLLGVGAALACFGRGSAGEGFGALFAITGLLIARWTHTLDRGRALGVCLVAAGLAAHALAGNTVSPVMPLAAATLWVMLGAMAYENDLGEGARTWIGYLCRPVCNTLVVCDRWGWPLASWAPLLASALAMTPGWGDRVLLVWGLWSIAAFLLAWAQGWLDRRAVSWLDGTATR